MSNATSPTPNCTYGFQQDYPSLERTVRSFSHHYLLYASQGAIRLELDRSAWLLPPQRAAWIAAHTEIAVRSDGPFRACSVLFDTRQVAPPPFACRVFAMSALAREMARHAMRWGPDRDPDDSVANNFFEALAQVCRDLYAHPDEFWLPQARSPALRRAIATVATRLDAPPTLGEIAAAAALSERTLARRLEQELGMNWRQYLNRARMIRAMELMARPDLKVLAVAHATGFTSQSAFTTAFKHFTGDTPTGYRNRFG